MNYKHIFEPAALDEYSAALEWYYERSENAAMNFVKEVKDKIKEVCSDPLRYRNTYKQFREKSLKKYPFCIVYLVDEVEKVVVISSVYHHKRNPRKKFRKS